ncbi:MAG TPA: hemolysin III family protein [Actinomycetota bacterium]|jgi:hemolysin III|nr:hemolysin III family protein [Actinomycetota bacterium]
MSSSPSQPVPTWRGRLHQIAFFVAIPAGIALVAVARGTSARVAAAVYATSLVGLYGTSATYHRLARSPRARLWMKRLDHSMIFVLIAGTVTPVAVLVVGPPWSIVLLAVVWGGAALGIALKMFVIDGFRVLTGTLYIVLGWVAVLTLPQLVRGLSVASLVLVVAGGILYTVGAVVLLRRRPDPAPRTFGYHEVWHSMVVAGSACHYVAVLLIVLAFRI